MNIGHLTDAAHTAPIVLEVGPVRADIIGGDLLSVSSLRYRGVELLADPSPLPLGYRVHAERTGITLLHPWANRLGADSFAFAGVRARLDGTDPHRLSRDAHGLAIHGLRAPQPWRPVQVSAQSAVASLTWLEESAFPYAHQTVVRFELSADGDDGATLTVATTIAALGASAVPVAFGWHPYFRCDLGAAIDLPRMDMLDSDGAGLPNGQFAPQEPTTIQRGDQGLDDGVAGLSPSAEMVLHNAEETIAVVFGAGYRWGQIFAPTDAPIVSFEPMAAPTNALCHGADLAVAEPERPFEAAFSVRITDGPARVPGGE